MKLNKKGFGVAEIAIVILLIGILAAAVIAGFMGIKKNANDVAEEQGKIAQTMSNDLKHSFPTILSGNKVGLKIKNGEYEVYELGGYKLSNNSSTVVNPLYVEEGGTLYLSGSGTLDDSCKIDNKYQPKSSAVVNYGNLTLSDLIVTGGNKNSSSSRYQVSCYGQSVTTLNNVKVTGANGTIYVFDSAKLYINGVNTNIVLPNGAAGSGVNLIYIALSGEVEVNDGTLSVEDQHNKYFGLQGGKLTINGGIFTDNAISSSIISIQELTYNGAYYDVNVEINGGVFNCAARDSFISFEYKGKVTITGGEFIKQPPRFVKNANNNAKGVLEIKDAPNDGTDPLVFHYAPTVGSDGGWGQYVAEGYEVYEIEAGKLWGVRPVTTPAN